MELNKLKTGDVVECRDMITKSHFKCRIRRCIGKDIYDGFITEIFADNENKYLLVGFRISLSSRLVVGDTRYEIE